MLLVAPFYTQEVQGGSFPGTVAIKEKNLLPPVELGQHLLQLPQREEMDLVLVILSNDCPRLSVVVVHLTAGARPDVAGFVDPTLGDVVVPGHSAHHDVGGIAVLRPPHHGLLLVVVPGAAVEFLILGDYVGEAEGSCPADGVGVVATGVQVAPVQARQVLVVLEDSLALAKLL